MTDADQGEQRDRFPRHPRGGVTTVGTGQVAVVPDAVVAGLATEVTDEDAPTALAQASSALAALRAGLLADGVRMEDLRTAGTSSWTSPEESQVGADGTTVVRRARTTVTLALTATLRDTATAGDVVQRALDAAGAAGRLRDTRFEVTDPSAARAWARALAFAEAEDAAQQLAGLAGRGLGPVLDVRETGPGEGAVPSPRIALAGGSGLGVPLDPGTDEVTVHLVVRYAWADRS